MRPTWLVVSAQVDRRMVRIYDEDKRFSIRVVVKML